MEFSRPFLFYFLFCLITLLSATLWLGWIYSVGINLAKKIPKTIRVNFRTFKLFISIVAIYFLFAVVFMFVNFNGDFFNTDSAKFLNRGVLLPLGLFVMFCLFYCIYFNAKVLKIVELQQTVKFSDFGGEFLLFWFFLFGIWIIQPRINRIFASAQAAK
jgi:hypothetical protein